MSTATTDRAAVSGPIETPPDAPDAPVRGRVAVITREDEQKSALARTPITDIATMSDEAFEQALARAAIARTRIDRILHHVLVDGAHYGNPKTPDGRQAFKKPILYQAGAEHLETTFRLTVYAVEPDTENVVIAPTIDDAGNVVDPGFVSITVHRALYTMDGTRLGVTQANCNSREKRFRKFGSGGTKWTYEDARETINDCAAMAEKRAKVRLVRAALGLTPWLANEEEMEAASEGEDKPITPWTTQEQRAVYAKAAAKGMSRKRFTAFVEETLGRAKVGTGPDVLQLLGALDLYEPPGKPAAAATTDPVKAETPAPASAPADERQPGEEEYQDDRAIAEADARANGELPLGGDVRRGPRSAVAEGH